jgi:predicted nucleic acid-binding protein
MPANVFFDTTVLVYILKEGDKKSAVADRLLAAGGVLSVQVLNEFANVARRKLGMGWKEIEEALANIRDLCSPPAALTIETHAAALKITKRYNFHIYDSLILASALENRCSILYSEDMQHGQKIESLTVQNPFLPVE